MTNLTIPLAQLRDAGRFAAPQCSQCGAPTVEGNYHNTALMDADADRSRLRVEVKTLTEERDALLRRVAEAEANSDDDESFRIASDRLADKAERMVAALRADIAVRDRMIVERSEDKIAARHRADKAEAEVKRLTADLALVSTTAASDTVKDATALADRDQRIAALEAALRPFATFAGRFGETAREDSWVLTRNPSGDGNLTMGDVRLARAALNREGGK